MPSVDHHESATALAGLPAEDGKNCLRVKISDCGDTVAFIQ